MRVVLGLEAAHVQEVIARFEPEPLERRARARPVGQRPVRDEVRLGAVVVAVVALDDARVGDQRIGQDRREVLREPVVGPRGQAPLSAPAFDPVDVERDRDARQPRDEREDGVGGVADQDRVVTRRKRVHDRQHRVHDRVGVLQPQRRKDHQADATVALARGSDVVRPAVDGDVVTARGQPRPALFGEGLEAAVVGRDAARAEDRELHPFTPPPPDGEGARRGHDEQKEREHLRVPEVVLEESGDDQRGLRAERGRGGDEGIPVGLEPGPDRAQHRERFPRELEHEPDPEREAGQPALGGDLQEVIVHVLVEPVGEFPRAPVAEGLGVDRLRSHAEPGVVADQAQRGRE